MARLKRIKKKEPEPELKAKGEVRVQYDGDRVIMDREQFSALTSDEDRKFRKATIIFNPFRGKSSDELLSITYYTDNPVNIKDIIREATAQKLSRDAANRIERMERLISLSKKFCNLFERRGKGHKIRFKSTVDEEYVTVHSDVSYAIDTILEKIEELGL